MESELLKQNYLVSVESPDFEDDNCEIKSVFKDLDTENFYIELEVDIEFKHSTKAHCEWCEVINVWLTEITVTDDNGISLYVSDQLHKKIEDLIEINYI